ncbi:MULTISPECIES: bifunctional GNAT family N-acetyltransferase/hotdog fold thioesterase [Corallincola]|uniref:GNAT family N-acetyltransferase n=3 Tax=Corallincola TaxID=1775176 RepID=A0A368NM77_9GAMM|nr:bifunctional GNAT family N-acetyltransferase/hotdog fold thioesterase [Corallincola holothuriorum]RCU51003.1 GNAT family N-acetyltransferase [Corallincola holothuriorum]
MFTLIEPKTDEELERYFEFRWQVMRAPFQLPKGSEKDEFDPYAHHRMLVDEQGLPRAVGRLYQSSADEGQLRHMAVDPDMRGSGLGSQVIFALEQLARELGLKRIVLNARQQALPFYEKQGYQAVGEGPTHFGQIHHQQMLKELPALNDRTRHADWCEELQKIWRDGIPISQALGIRIIEYSGERFETRAAFNANINLHGTLFAGSAYSQACLTGWGMIYMMLKEQGLSGSIALSHGEIRHLRPLTEEPTAYVSRAEVEGSVHPLRRGEQAHLSVTVTLEDSKQPLAAQFKGEYLVLSAGIS